jgi:hypothetical protein
VNTTAHGFERAARTLLVSAKIASSAPAAEGKSLLRAEIVNEGSCCHNQRKGIQAALRLPVGCSVMFQLLSDFFMKPQCIMREIRSTGVKAMISAAASNLWD